jgi:hypothetical protein
MWSEIARWHLQLEIILRAVTAEFGLALDDLEGGCVGPLGLYAATKETIDLRLSRPGVPGSAPSAKTSEFRKLP